MKRFLPAARLLIPAVCVAAVLVMSRSSNLPKSLMLQQTDYARSKIGKREDNEIRQDSGKFIQSDYWIVVTSISYPTEDIRRLAKIPGWKVVVVGDTKTPRDWSYPNCVYLSIDDQLQLGFETAARVPMKSYARKNIGYLFAIAHGAQVIYETDDDNHPTDHLKHFHMNPNFTGLMYNGRNVFNPYRHFGQPTLWPRGYPLSSIGENITTDYRLGQWKTPLIQQGVVNGDPDMDAIFRLTRKKTLSILNVTFDETAPPVILPSGVFSPFNSQNTLFLYDALWAMLIPTTTAFRVCDIWRGYWAQRLLWEIDGNLGFFPPNAFQKRNSHSYLLDAMDEKDLYFETERLLNFLRNWKCAPKNSFFDCVSALSWQMMKEGFWKENDSSLTNSWVRDLRAVGYREPARVPFPNVDGTTKPSSADGQKTSPKHVPVTFWAAEQPAPSIYRARPSRPGLLSHLLDIARLCQDKNMNSSLHMTLSNFLNISRGKYHNIVLIVGFKDHQYQNLYLIEALYRANFPNIVYCGETNTGLKFQAVSSSLQYPVTFMEVDINNGLSRQTCLTSAMKMGFNVDGFLYISDDTLLDVMHLHQLPLDRIWHQYSTVKRHDTARGNTEMVQKASKQNSIKENPRYRMSFMNYNSTVNFLSGSSDVLYLPRIYKDDFIFFTEQFTQQDIFFDKVIQTVLPGIDKLGRLFLLPKKYVLFQGKNTVNDTEKRGKIEETLHSYVCNRYIPWVSSVSTL